MLIYQLAAQKTFGWQVEKLIFYYLNNNSTVEFLASQEELKQEETKINETIEKILTTDFTATPAPINCKFCDFSHICPYKQL